MLDIFDDLQDTCWEEEIRNWRWVSTRQFQLNMSRFKYALQYAIQTS